MTEPQEVIAIDAPNTVAMKRDIHNELSATTAAWFDKRQERKSANKVFKEELDALEERMEELIGEIKAGGTQLVMHFGTHETPTDDEVDDSILSDDDDFVDDEDAEDEDE